MIRCRCAGTGRYYSARCPDHARHVPVHGLCIIGTMGTGVRPDTAPPPGPRPPIEVMRLALPEEIPASARRLGPELATRAYGYPPKGAAVVSIVVRGPGWVGVWEDGRYKTGYTARGDSRWTRASAVALKTYAIEGN